MIKYTWNDEWIKNDESPFSILQKFLYANEITGPQLKLELNERLIEFLVEIGVPLSVIKESLSERQVTELYKYCPKCIQHGYHCNNHQSFQYCHIHGEKLISKCKKCKRNFPYNRLTKKYYKKPYVCACGYQMQRNYDQDDLLFKWFDYSIPGPNYEIKQTIVYENSIQKITFNVSEKKECEIYETAIKGIFVLFSDLMDSRHTFREYGFKISYRSDVIMDNYEIIGGFEAIVEEMFFKDNYFLNPFISNLNHLIRKEIKQLGLRYYDYKSLLFKCYGSMLHTYFLDLTRYKYVIPLILSIIKIHLKKKRIQQISIAVYEEDLSDFKSLNIPIKYLNWYESK